jgi:hypothetical protein
MADQMSDIRCLHHCTVEVNSESQLRNVFYKVGYYSTVCEKIIIICLQSQFRGQSAVQVPFVSVMCTRLHPSTVPCTVSRHGTHIVFDVVT